ncbi:DUF6965 family protein [Psychroflexus sp. MBR-150]|jgi:hypothetical protein
MNEYRYILDRSSKKFVCPNCDKKRFVKYIDTVTGTYLSDKYGRCDREINCGYHSNPYDDKDNAINYKPKQPKVINKPKTAFIPVEVLKQTLLNYDKNIFIQNLLNKIAFPFDVKSIETVISLYRLGTVRKTGAVCFPYIDINQNIRAVQEKIFDATNHTDKSKKYHTSWLHSRLQYSEYRYKPLPEWLKAYNQNEKIVSCLFGEHLLNKYPDNPIALVEAPKTAIYGTLYFGFPEQSSNLLWLSVFNLSSLTLNKCKPLKNRDVYLFPDLSKDGKAFELWDNKAKYIQERIQGAYFKVSDLLERLAPKEHKEQGNDLADYLIKQDWRKYRTQPKAEPPQPVDVSKSEKREKCEASKKTFFLQQNETFENDLEILNTENKKDDWSKSITQLENYFDSVELPTNPIKFNQCSRIIDVSKFIESHLNTVKANNGNKTYKPYLNRLQELKEILTINSN